ncbi:MAG: cobalamin biosynthesis protein [Mesorhizobium sp.]|nr:cobalamin biosynthesis protein [Mesorhizobium sp.]MBL8575952.1 cobalamin biosynthesis protein [Mesorhizobium sp.]
MIVAGIGSRKGVSAVEVIAAVEHALAEHALSRDGLAMLATASLKGNEPGIIAASGMMNLPLVLVDTTALEDVSAATLTTSSASIAAANSPSVSEAAALAAAGQGARLAGPRVIVGSVTCAIAFGVEP